MQDKRELIIDATKELFAEKGFAKLRVSDISTRAGIGKSTVYEYFDSKDDIILAVVNDVLSSDYEKYFSVVHQSDSVEKKVEEYVKASWKLMQKYGIHAMLFFSEAFYGTEMSSEKLKEILVKIRNDQIALTRSIVDYGTEQGRIDSSIDPEKSAQYILSMVGLYMHAKLLVRNKEINGSAFALSEGECMVDRDISGYILRGIGYR